MKRSLGNPDSQEDIGLTLKDSTSLLGSSTPTNPKNPNSKTEHEYFDGDNKYSRQELYPTVFEEIVAIIQLHGYYLLVAGIVAGVSIVFAIAHHTHVDISEHHNPTTIQHHADQISSRWIPTIPEQKEIKQLLLRSVSTIKLSGVVKSEIFGNTMQDSEFVSIQAFYLGNEQGHEHLPRSFYEGVHLGVSATDFKQLYDKYEKNPNDVEEGKSIFDEVEQKALLKQYLLNKMAVKPAAIYDWQLNLNGTHYTEHGLVCSFPFDDLKEQNAFNELTGGRPDFSKATNEVAKAARKFNQLAIYQWHPITFGAGVEEDDLLHKNIIQDVYPVRSGLQEVGSSSVVWKRGNDGLVA